MNSNGMNSLYNKALPAILVAVIIGGFSFWNSVTTEIAIVKDDMQWYKDTYKNDQLREKENYGKLEKKIELIMLKEDNMKDLLTEIISRLKVIEYELKISNGKNK